MRVVYNVAIRTHAVSLSKEGKETKTELRDGKILGSATGGHYVLVSLLYQERELQDLEKPERLLSCNNIIDFRIEVYSITDAIVRHSCSSFAILP